MVFCQGRRHKGRKGLPIDGGARGLEIAGQQADGVQGAGHVGSHHTETLLCHLLEVRLGSGALKVLDDAKHNGRRRDAAGSDHSQMERTLRP